MVNERVLVGVLAVALGCWLLIDPTAPYRPFVSFRFVGLLAALPLLSFGFGLLLVLFGGKTLVGSR